MRWERKTCAEPVEASDCRANYRRRRGLRVGAACAELVEAKENHPNLYEDVTLWMDTEFDAGWLEVLETVEKDHGRLEVRRYALSTRLEWLDGRDDWSGLKALGMVESRREIGDKVSMERRYYLCSRPELEHFARHCRAHWSTENSQHSP